MSDPRDAGALLPQRGEDFDRFYATTPPWDIGAPQPGFAALAEAGALRGRVLDVGCGTGEHALLAATHGLEAVGIDAAPRAIDQARAKAAQRGLAAQFVVGDALELSKVVEGMFDTVIDSALFHVFSDEHRARFVDSVGAVMVPGGRYYLLCFSERMPGTEGPRRVTQDEIRASFSDGWSVDAIEPAQIRTTIDVVVPAWLATITRA